MSNTPQSVLCYIDAIWRQHEPPDPLILARELGFSPKAYRGLKAKHGDGLTAHLLKVQRERGEQPRWMATQNGQRHPQQYVSSPHGAIDDAESVDEVTQKRFSDRSRREEVDRANELVIVVEDLRLAIRQRAEGSDVFRREAGRSLYRISAELDRVVKNAKRRAA